MVTPAGILAVWNDCRPGDEAEYEAWYQGEHLRERVAVPGFVYARRFVGIENISPRYFTYYETTTPDVLRSPAYLERGANPTPLTRHIMGGIFQNMTRTVCRRAERAGEMEGAYALAVRATGATAAAHLQAAWQQLAALQSRVRAELWLSAEAPGQAPSIEEKMRGADKKINACVLIEFAAAAHAAEAAYRVMCALRQRDLAGA
jgi:hypothetical protein